MCSRLVWATKWDLISKIKNKQVNHTYKGSHTETKISSKRYITLCLSFLIHILKWITEFRYRSCLDVRFEIDTDSISITSPTVTEKGFADIWCVVRTPQLAWWVITFWASLLLHTQWEQLPLYTPPQSQDNGKELLKATKCTSETRNKSEWGSICLQHPSITSLVLGHNLSQGRRP